MYPVRMEELESEVDDSWCKILKRSELNLLIDHAFRPAIIYLLYTEGFQGESGFFFRVLVWTTLIEIHKDFGRCREGNFLSLAQKLVSNIVWFLMAEWLLLQMTAFSWKAMYKLNRQMHQKGPEPFENVLEFISTYFIKTLTIYLRIISSLAKYRVVNFIIQIFY